MKGSAKVRKQVGEMGPAVARAAGAPLPGAEDAIDGQVLVLRKGKRENRVVRLVG